MQIPGELFFFQSMT